MSKDKIIIQFIHTGTTKLSNPYSCITAVTKVLIIYRTTKLSNAYKEYSPFRFVLIIYRTTKLSNNDNARQTTTLVLIIYRTTKLSNLKFKDKSSCQTTRLFVNERILHILIQFLKINNVAIIYHIKMTYYNAQSNAKLPIIAYIISLFIIIYK